MKDQVELNGYTFCKIKLASNFQRFPASFFIYFWTEISFVAPVEIRAASSCIFSSSCLSFWVQLSYMVLAYSITGGINELYIVSNDFLSSKNLSFLIMFILAQAFSLI